MNAVERSNTYIGTDTELQLCLNNSYVNGWYLPESNKMTVLDARYFCYNTCTLQAFADDYLELKEVSDGIAA